MTTYDNTVGGTKAIRANALTPRVITAKVDIQAAANALNSGTAFSAADVLKVLNIPANTFVLEAGLICTVAEDTTMTLDLGDGDDDNGYIDAYDAESTGSSITTVALGYGVDNVHGVFYDTADTIDLTIVTIGAQTEHQCVVTVFALVLGPIPTS